MDVISYSLIMVVIVSFIPSGFLFSAGKRLHAMKTNGYIISSFVLVL